MNKKFYDIMKYVALIAMPAMATLYYALSVTWGLPYTSEIVATITSLDVFIGTLIGIDSYKQNKNNEEDTNKWGL